LASVGFRESLKMSLWRRSRAGRFGSRMNWRTASGAAPIQGTRCVTGCILSNKNDTACATYSIRVHVAQALLADDGNTKAEGAWLVTTLCAISIDPDAGAAGTVVDAVGVGSVAATVLKSAIKEALSFAGSVIADVHEEVLDVLAEVPLVRVHADPAPLPQIPLSHFCNRTSGGHRLHPDQEAGRQGQAGHGEDADPREATIRQNAAYICPPDSDPC
jgi:hypothetical protein